MARVPNPPGERRVRRTNAPHEGLPVAIGRLVEEFSDAPVTIGEAPGYGPRDPQTDGASVLHWKQARLWARLEFVVGVILTGLCPFFFLRSSLSSVTPESLPWAMLWDGAFVLYSLACLWVGTWFALRPAIAWDDRGIEMRHRPWRAPVRVTPQEVVWRPESRYVGRYLFAHPAGHSPVRFPLWMIRRAGARRLFAYLDRSHVARE